VRFLKGTANDWLTDWKVLLILFGGNWCRTITQYDVFVKYVTNKTLVWVYIIKANDQLQNTEVNPKPIHSPDRIAEGSFCAVWKNSNW
jgi:hypothetical protein